MHRLILKCEICNKYTLKTKCICGAKAIDSKPAKYSLEDKWGKWRRISKKSTKNDV